MRVLGVDPGISGGLAVVEITDGAAPALVECIDIPVVGTGAKERVDVAAIRNFIDRHKPIRALIERAQAMPKQGASVGFQVRPRGRRDRSGDRAVFDSGRQSSSRRSGNGSGDSPARTRKAGGSRRCSCFRPRMRRSRARKTMAGPRHR